MTCSIERCRAFRGPPIVSCWRGSLCGAAYGGCESLYGSLGAYQGLKPGNWKGYTSLRPVLCGRSSPPRQIPSTRAPNTSDVRTTLSVCVESAVRAATAVLGAPPALSSSTALRKYHGGDTEDDRDNECSKHGFSSVGLGLSVRFDSTVITHLAGWQAVWWLVEVSTRCAWRAVGR
jgi:hypothetical protein